MPTTAIIPSEANNTDFWKAFRRHFPTLCLISHSNTLQAQGTFYKSKGWDCFYSPPPQSPSPCKCSSCSLLGEPAKLCPWGREGAGCQRQNQADTFLACDQSLTPMWFGSVYLFTFAIPRQWESTKRNSTEATTLKKIKIKKKKILKRNYPADLIGNKKMYSIYKFFCILVLKT